MKTKIILTCCFVAVFAAIQLSACNKGGSQQAAHIAEAQTQENALNEQVTYDPCIFISAIAALTESRSSR